MWVLLTVYIKLAYSVGNLSSYKTSLILGSFLILVSNTMPTMAHDAAASAVEEAKSARSEEKSADKLRGQITVTTTCNDPLSRRIDDLVNVALEKANQDDKLSKSVKHYRSLSSKVAARTADAANYVINFRGYSMSSEAGDIVLGEKSKVKSAASAEYLHQRRADDIQLKISSSIMQIAMGLGMSDKQRGESEVVQGKESLQALVGEEEAQKTIDAISEYAQKAPNSEASVANSYWTIGEKRTKMNGILEQCLDKDPVIQDIKNKVHRFNKRGKLYLATARVVETSLGLASLSPTLVAPAAQLALFCFDMVNGGSEEWKLLRELYLDKRLDSRSHLLSETAHMSLEGYQIAKLTNNSALDAVSQCLVERMVGSDNARQVFSPIAATPQAEANTDKTPAAPASEKQAQEPAAKEVPTKEATGGLVQ